MAWPWQKVPAQPVADIEERGSAEWGSSAIPLPGMGGGGGFYSFTGRYISVEQAAGLSSVGAAVRLIAETIGSLPAIVYKGEGADRSRATSSWQYQLIHDRPNMEQSAMEFWTDISACLEFAGNAFIQKVKAGSRVLELQVIDPMGVKVYRDKSTGEKRFDVTVEGAHHNGMTSAEILHIRGFTTRGGLVGVSPISEHRQALGVALAAEEYAGRMYANDATPGLAVTVPGNLGRQQAAEMLAVWNATHAGMANAGKPAILTNGATLSKLGMTMADAELIASRRYGVEEVARIFRIPAAMLGVESRASNISAEEESLRFVRYGLIPRLRRIEMALRCDDDLFPAGSQLEPEWLVDGLLRADTQVRYAAYVQARQAGWLSANEIRSLENYPPVEGGDQVQQTPVGGAPNAAAPAPTTQGGAA